MQCSLCQHENPAAARFCNSCGAALELRCGACELANPEGSRFCNHCGASLGDSEAVSERRAQRELSDEIPAHLAAKILRDRSAIEGERKQVTVLFADLEGSTSLAEGIDPEEMHGLIDRALQGILQEVHRYEGAVNQFTGDGVMALFGAPIAIENASRCAVLAALAIQERLAPMDAEVQERFGRGFRMRIGLHSGPVVVGTIGDDLKMDYTAIGDTVNLAARIEPLSPPGGVAISDAVRRQIDLFFDLEALEPTSVKGKKGIVQAYSVVGQRAASGRIDAHNESELTPYVGRKHELEVLLSAFDSARDGRGQVVFVAGEAGIGKSRLLYQFREALGDLPHLWLEGRCAPYARKSPFHALADGVRRWVGIDDRDDEAAASAKLEAREGVTAELSWTTPFLRQLLSLRAGNSAVEEMDAMSRRAETSRAVLALLLRASQDAPLVVVIEDLHWIDTASEEFLGYLADSIPAARVLLVLTHRPGYAHPFGDRSYHVRLPVQALSAGAMSAMVSSVLESERLPPGLDQLIARKADGNPLFVEEMLHSLVEEGTISRETGVLSLARKVSDISVPDRIQDVLMARLDRLNEGPKRAIQAASVIGREFALGLLERITEAGSQIEGIVGELRDLELILQKAAHPELAYMFKHALTHDVAYESVLLRRRRKLHGIVGRAIEELYQDRLPEHYEALAHHFSEAEDWARAFEYHDLASQKSAAAFANHAAADHCRAAIAIADRLGGRIESAQRLAIHIRLALCCFAVSEFLESGEAFTQAAQISTQREEQVFLGARSSFSFLWAHEYPQALAAVEKAEELARPGGAEAGRAFVFIARDQYNLIHGSVTLDDGPAEAAIEVAQSSGSAPVLITCLSHAAQRAEWRAEYRRAIAFGERAVEVATRERLPGEALFGQWFLGISYVAVGDYGRGIRILTDGIDVADRVGDRAVKVRLLNTLGWAYAELSCHGRAAEYNRAATEGAREMVELGLVAGAPELYANAAINLAGNLTALGHLGAAADQLAPIEAQLEASDDPWMEWRYSLHVLHASARIALARGDAERALSLARRESEGAEQRSVRKVEARGLEMQARALVVMDQRAEAAKALERALEMAREIEYAPVEWRALALRGELARRQGGAAEATQHFAAAQSILVARAQSLEDKTLRGEFLTLAARLADDPVGAYR